MKQLQDIDQKYVSADESAISSGYSCYQIADVNALQANQAVFGDAFNAVAKYDANGNLVAEIFDNG